LEIEMSAKNRGAKVAEHEFYPTPRATVESLINEVTWPSKATYGDPCAGDSAIMIPFVKMGLSEPWWWEWAEIREGKDYLKDGLTGPVDAIITNPPFSLATDFIDRSLGEALFVAYLLRLNFWGSRKRKDWWQGKEPTHQFTLSERPSFTGKGTDATEYAWFVWDRLGLCKRPPGMYVI
jgi:hypothetical protein